MLVYKISESPSEYSGVAGLMFIVCYTLQLYADFSGFIDIAIGGGQLFGIKMDENFRQPFFAKSAQEFWQRWHITLGSWLKDYVFYSVALSPKLNKACNKLKKKHKNHFTKMLPTAVALLAVWICNGLWHGPEWKYIVFGLYYFVIIVSGMMLEPLFKKSPKNQAQPRRQGVGSRKTPQNAVDYLCRRNHFRRKNPQRRLLYSRLGVCALSRQLLLARS